MYSRLTVFLFILMYIAPVWTQADTSRPKSDVPRNYVLLAFNQGNARAYPQSGRFPPCAHPNVKALAPHRNMPPGHNRGFGYGFERRHPQPVSVPAPRRPF